MSKQGEDNTDTIILILIISFGMRLKKLSTSTGLIHPDREITFFLRRGEKRERKLRK